MAKRRGNGPSTVKLLGLAFTMLLVGLGMGALLSSYGCDKKGKGKAEEEFMRPEPKRPVRPAQPKPPKPEEDRSEAPPPEEPPHPVPPKAPVEPPVKLPRMALVIDDLGYANPELVKRLCAQPIPFAVAVLPYLEFTHQSAEIAHGRGKEVMLHLPMEPLGYPGPGKNPGTGAVFFHHTEPEVRDAVRKALADIPHRKGVNNHMGSRITPDRTRMGWVLQEIKHADCFFVDSRTEKNTVAFDVAEKLKVPAIQRKVFLDDDKSFAEMKKQWERAIALARKDGQVVIIGHIYPETVEALEKLVPAAQKDVRFVKVSELAR